MAAPKRTIVLHYHLFKNAGTSLDLILRHNFGAAWVTREFSCRGSVNSAAAEAWIAGHPEAVAFSSHTMEGPYPQVPDVRIISLMLLRHPIARIKSVYQFERIQNAQTFGAKLAKETTFEGYVRKRLARKNDFQCRNFQTHRLASLVPGDEPVLERAREALGLLSLVGTVECFSMFVEQLGDLLRPAYPDFQAIYAKANQSRICAEPQISAEVLLKLERANADDLQIWQAVHLKG